MADFLFKPAPGMAANPEITWRNYAQGTMLELTLASGVVIGTLFASEGILKGVYVPAGGNNGALTVRADGNSKGVFASGALDGGWNPCWLSFNTSLTLNSATAQLLQFLIGTGLPPFV